MINNGIIISDVQHEFIEEKNEKREMCEVCSLKQICFERLKTDNMICKLFFEGNVKNGSFKIK